MSVVRRVAKRFGSSLLERYWPETEHLSKELASAVWFKTPAYRYVPDLNKLFALTRGWVITIQKYLQSEDHQEIKHHNRNITGAKVDVKHYELVGQKEFNSLHKHKR